MKNYKDGKMFRIAGLWGIFVLVIGGMVFGMVKLNSRGSADKNMSLSLTAAVTESDWVRGDRKAQIIITEYSDFQCPACAAYYGLVKQLHNDFTDKVAVAYRHFPLKQIHGNALNASLAAEAAGRQNKFWEMHDMIFENQKEWAEKRNAEEIFTSYAQNLNLDLDQFKNDFNSKELKRKIETDYQSGIKIGIDHTPTFFVNGKEIENPRNYDEFKNIINEVESDKS